MTVTPVDPVHKKYAAERSRALSRRVIGIDLGGTKILAAIADGHGEFLAKVEQPTRHGAGAPVLAQIVEIIGLLACKTGVTVRDIDGIVLGVPGAVDPRTGIASLSPNLALPQDVALCDLLAPHLACPVHVENDVNLAAFGEATAGAGRGRSSLAFLSFGTGVGLGLVAEGKLWRGEFGRAGEVGYLPIGASPHLGARASQNGLYEDAVGSAGIRTRFQLKDQPVAALFVAARAGDADARAALDALARDASIGVAAVQTLFDPGVTVVGGGIGSQPEFLSLLKVHLASLLPFDCDLQPSHFGVEAGLVGAVRLALTQVDDTKPTAPER